MVIHSILGCLVYYSSASHCTNSYLPFILWISSFLFPHIHTSTTSATICRLPIILISFFTIFFPLYNYFFASNPSFGFHFHQILILWYHNLTFNEAIMLQSHFCSAHWFMPEIFFFLSRRNLWRDCGRMMSQSYLWSAQLLPLLPPYLNFSDSLC